MKVPLLDLKPQLQTIDAELKQAVNDVIDSTRYVLGPRVERLEREIAEYTGARFAVGMSSGTDALLAGLMALNVGAGDLVVTPAYSFFATAGVVARLGATPVFVDNDAKTYNLSPTALHQWFENEPESRRRVKAVIPVHLYGQCADMDAIMDVANGFDVPVIEDAAQSLGAQYPSRHGLKHAGTIGKMGCYSFFPTKNLACIGEGGMIVTDDERLADRLRLLRNHGAQRRYYHSIIGGNFRLDALQAAVLSVKLPHLNKWNESRRTNAAYYDEHFAGTGIVTPAIAYARENHVYNQYIIAVPDRRDDLRKHLAECGIGHEVYYPVPFHEQECFSGLGYRSGEFPSAEFAARHTLALPIYPELTTEMLSAVVDAVAGFYRAA